MSGLIPASPADSYSSDHSRFFSNSDDDADTASQRSISLSSGPSSPKPKRGFSLATPASPALSTPMSTSFPHHDDDDMTPISPSDHSPDEPMHSDEEMETHSTTGSGPSPSFKFDEEEEGGHTRHSSMSSSASLFSRDEDETKQQTRGRTHLRLDTSYPPPSQGVSPASAVSAVSDYGPAHDHRAADVESLASANTGKSGVSAGSGGRKVRPESTLLETPDDPLVLGVALVDFNHIVGPRVEFFEGKVFEDEEIVRILPFLALPDGAHLSSEDYSYFHLVPAGPKPITLFGISCNRQISSSELLARSDDVTRSTVQKAVVILASKPVFGAVRDKLGVVTNAYFNQRDFSETAILTDFTSTLESSLRGQLTESGLYMGTSLRELVRKFRHRTLILLKALILQRKIMFYGHPVERLCTYQYSLISLIPCLLQTLDDCGSPPLAAKASTRSRPSSLRTSDRKSLLTFVGFPLDIFGKDAFFQPYLPLQQVEIAQETSSWLCGCTNSIVYTQSNYELLVNTENNAFEFKDPKLEKLVALTPPDRKWIDDIVRDVNETWNEDDPTRPTGMQFKGSDDYLRTKFEEYISALLSTVKYSDFLAKGERNGIVISDDFDRACVPDFGPAWITAFRTTQAYDLWNRITDPVLFDIIEPKHPCIDKPTAVSDLGLQISESFRDLKIDQQLAPISNVFTSGSTSFFKAMDGFKGRWGSRTPSTASVPVVTSTKPETSAPEEPVEGNGDATPTNPSTPAFSAPPSTPIPAPRSRPSSVASLFGSFFSARASRFSLSRNSTSEPIALSVPSTPAPSTPALHDTEEDKRADAGD